MARRGLILLGSLTACGPKLQPLSALEAELAQTTPAPQGTVVLDDGALSSMAAELLGRPHSAPGPLGMRVVVVPELSDVSVRADEGPTGSVGVTAELAGTLDVAFPLASQDDLAFDGTLRAPVAASVRPDAEGSWVLLGWGGAVQADVTLPDATPELEALTTGLVQGALTGALAEPKGALIPPTPWGPVSGVTLAAVDGDLVAHVMVAGAPGEQAEPVTPPPGGFAVVVSEASLLGLLQELAVTSQDEETYVVEPMGVVLTEGVVRADLRVHKRARKEKWRRYTIEGPLVWSAGRLHLDAPELQLVEARKWSRGVSVRIGEGRALSALQEGVGGLPTALVQPVTADLALQLAVQSVRSSDGQLVVEGPLTVVPRP